MKLYLESKLNETLDDYLLDDNTFMELARDMMENDDMEQVIKAIKIICNYLDTDDFIRYFIDKYINEGFTSVEDLVDILRYLDETDYFDL